MIISKREKKIRDDGGDGDYCDNNTREDDIATPIVRIILRCLDTDPGSVAPALAPAVANDAPRPDTDTYSSPPPLGERKEASRESLHQLR